MKKTKWLAVCMAAMMALFAAGCKNSSDGPDSVPVEKVTLDKTTLTLTVGGTATLKATVEPNDADDKTVTWESSNEAFATVDKDGKVTAVAAGTATITAKAGGKSATCEITVTSVAVETIDMYKKTLSLDVGVMEKLNVRILPEEAAGVTVKWSSSKPEVATVGDDGTVKGVKVGRATITAQAGEITDTCEVTVSAHTHYYVSLKCQTCGFDKPSFKEGDIDDYGTLTAYTGSGTTVAIPKGVTRIGDGVFKGKTSLTSVTLPDGMTRIDSSAFEGCTGLTSMTIPDGVTYIAYHAFKDCTSLASVTIPDSVTDIGQSAFEGCTRLTSVTYGGTKAEWKAIDGSDDVNITCIICDDGYIGVKEVPEYLKMDGTTVTGYNDGLPAKLVIPDGVTKIGMSAFEGCTTLETVTIPGSVTEIEHNNSYSNGAFSGCTKLTTVTMGDGVKTIGGNAFYGCESLASVTIPGSVTKIWYRVFEWCTSLTSVTYGGTKAEWKAIEGSDYVNITRIDCNDGYIGVEVVPEYLKMDGTTVAGYTDGLPAKLVIPDGATEIGWRAFDGCTTLETVTIPGSVTKIVDYAFRKCTSLASVTIPGSVTEIGSYVFKDCTSLTSVKYGGTKAQWEAITGDGKDDLKGKTITCTDGEVTVE